METSCLCNKVTDRHCVTLSWPPQRSNHADEQPAFTRKHHVSSTSHYLPTTIESLKQYCQAQKGDPVLLQVRWYSQEVWPQTHSLQGLLTIFMLLRSPPGVINYIICHPCCQEDDHDMAFPRHLWATMDPNLLPGLLHLPLHLPLHKYFIVPTNESILGKVIVLSVTAW